MIFLHKQTFMLFIIERYDQYQQNYGTWLDFGQTPEEYTPVNVRSENLEFIGWL